MRDNQKTKAELLKEVETLRKRVAELRQAEEALRESEEKWRSLLNNTPDIVMIVDRDGTIRFINHTVSTITEQEAIGKRVYDYISPEHHDRMRKDLERIFQTGQGASHEISGVGRHGDLSWYQAKLGPVRQDGRIVAASIITRDITEHKRAEEALRESRRRFRSLVEVTSDWVWEVDQNGIYTYASPKIKELLGYEPQEVIGKTPFDFMLPGEAERVDGLFKDIIKSRKPFNCLENTNLHKDGREVVLETSGVPIFDEGGNLLGYRGIDRDITEHKRAEEEIGKFKRMADRATFGYAMADLNGNLTYINESFAKMHGYVPDELIGKNLKIFHADAQMKYVSELNKRLLETGKDIRNEEVWHVHRDGTEFPTLMHDWVLEDPDGKPLLMCATAIDITEHKRAEDALRESENKYRTLLENIPQKIFLKDRNSVYMSCNENYAGDFKIKSEEIVGKTDYDFHPRELAEKYRADDKRIMESGGTVDIEEKYIQQGQEVVVHTVKTPVKDAHGNVIGILGVFWDVTEQKRAEEALKKSEEKYRLLFESTGTDNNVISVDGVYLMMNEKGAEHLGGRPEHFVGKSVYDTFPKGAADEYVKRFRHVAESGEIKIYEDLVELPTGNRWFLTNMRPVKDPDGNITSVQLISQDITEHKKAEEELNEYREKMAQAERLASLGTLSATLAHELNQPLTAIRLSIENSLADLETTSSPDTVIEDLKDGLSAVSDVASKIDSLRNFAQESSKEIISEVNLKAVAERILNLLNESARRAGVSLHLKGMDKLPLIQSNEKDLEQLFFALVENAIQAADGKKECRLIISGDVKDEHIELRFSDTCGGIAPENLDRIFEPFFTTRAVSERTGLGLCIVERIVSGAGGKIRVESKAGKGSTFFVTLPISRGRMS